MVTLHTKTMIMWDDVFVTLWVGGQDKWSILPEWENRVKKMKKYKGEL
jgi:hypothetical protein